MPHQAAYRTLRLYDPIRLPESTNQSSNDLMNLAQNPLIPTGLSALALLVAIYQICYQLRYMLTSSLDFKRCPASDLEFQ